MLEAEVARVLDSYRTAVFEKDVDALLALYDVDARVFDLWGEWSYEGRAAWRGAVEQWLGSLGDERVIVLPKDMRSVVAGGVAVVHAFVTYQGESAAGEKLRAMQNRLTWVLRQHGDDWKIVHEHTSVPADPRTGKVILRG